MPSANRRGNMFRQRDLNFASREQVKKSALDTVELAFAKWRWKLKVCSCEIFASIQYLNF